VLERRRTSRQASGWNGTCLVENEMQTEVWRECAVLDISPFGLGITLRDADSSRSELIGRGVTVEFPAVSDWVSIRVEGKIRNAVLIRPGLVRAGVEFVGLSEAERAIATVLGVLTAIDEEWAESQAIQRPMLPQAIA
jgi:hypothetical protein